MTTGYNYLPPPLIRPPAPAFVRTTPEPVYVEPEPIREADKPAKLDGTAHTQALAAARWVRKHYPGAAGEVLAEAIDSYNHFSYLAAPGSPVARLIREVNAAQQEPT